jgi:hypothetical protein
MEIYDCTNLYAFSGVLSNVNFLCTLFYIPETDICEFSASNPDYDLVVVEIVLLPMRSLLLWIVQLRLLLMMSLPWMRMSFEL